MQFSIDLFKFAYCLTNFGEKSLSPVKSSVTRIWPSQYLDAPIPIVGIEIFAVIFFANFSITHSIIIAKAPALEISIASLKIFLLSMEFFPLALKFLEVWGNRPTWPRTGIPLFTRKLTIFDIFFPPSSFIASHFVNFITFFAFLYALK